MFIYVNVDLSKITEIREKIINLGFNVSVSPINAGSLIIKIKEFEINETKQEEIDNKLRIDGIKKIVFIKQFLKVEEVELKESLRTNWCRFVFDVDSTLTRGGPGTVHPTIHEIFQKMTDKGIWIYLATGRSMPDLNTLVMKYPVQKYSIAENGGIILGFPPQNYFEFGNKTEPDKVLSYLQSQYGVKENMEQGERITEVIFLKKDVTKDQIDEAIKQNNAHVSIHESQNSYHISKNGIDKGSAVLDLADRLHWKNRMIIAVGDAGMDIPMFEKAGYSFAVNNATEAAKSAAKQVLDGDYENGIRQIYEIIEKVA